MRLCVSLAIPLVPPADAKFVTLVSRTNVFEVVTGTCVRYNSAELSVLIPSFAVAVEDGNVPSGRKFKNEVKTRPDGDKAEL